MKTFNEYSQEQICETANAGLANKAEKSGVSISTLRKVYRRGVAAWNSGHRPGTTPQQWGMARVNSYITKGKGTYGGADKDLHEEELDEVAKDKESGLAKKYVAGLSASTAKARAAHWKEKDKLSDRDPRAYEPAPGDKTAKTKLSKHTKKYHAMYGESMDEEILEACWVGYKQVGVKKKGQKMVPNCVPEAANPAQQAAIAIAMKKAGKKPKMQEAIQYHIDHKISFTENVFRPGSDKFFELVIEAKRLYKEGKYGPEDEYEQDLLNSNIGEKAMYEGKEVMLDFPFVEEIKEDSDPTGGHGIGKPFRKNGGGAVYVKDGGKVRLVNFSQSGMKKRINEPGRVRSFVARHHCLTNKDRTSASYWACRWPRYFSNTGQQWW